MPTVHFEFARKLRDSGSISLLLTPLLCSSRLLPGFYSIFPSESTSHLSWPNPTGFLPASKPLQNEFSMTLA
jgi:hypothetical protein